MMMMIINILMVCVWVTQGSLAPTLEADPSTGGLTLTIDKDETAALWIKHGDDGDPQRVVTTNELEATVQKMILGALAGNGLTSPLVDQDTLESAIADATAASKVLLAAAMEQVKQLQAQQVNTQLCNDVGLVYNALADHCDDPKVIDCGAHITNLPAHLVQGTCAGDSSYRGRCAVACAAGYEAKSTNFTCGLDGAWAGLLDCEPLECFAADLGERTDMVLPSPFTVGNCTDEFYVFGESCTLGCEKGYAPAGSIEIHCQADQTYSAPDGECDEVCGDGLILGNEVCDDGKNHGVGCVFDCKHVSKGFVCDDDGGKVCTTVCGDKVRAGDEECDDGNNKAGDGCSPKCIIEDNWGCDDNGVCDGKCGDGVIAGFEECDNKKPGCTDKCRAAAAFGCNARDNTCKPLTSCIGIKDGTTKQILPGGARSQAVVAVCDQDYYIINPAKDDKWATYFKDVVEAGKDHTAIYAPSKASLLKNQHHTWYEWFKLTTYGNDNGDEGTFTFSEDCKTCDTSSKIAGLTPYSTGDLIGCTWFQKSCPMTKDNQCHECNLGDTDQLNGGSCTHIMRKPAFGYRGRGGHDPNAGTFFEKDCDYNWWHLMPALGRNGKNCVCFKPTF